MNLSNPQSFSPRVRRLLHVGLWGVVAVVLMLVFGGPLKSWFGLGEADAVEATASGAAAPLEYSASDFRSMQGALDDYDKIRKSLASDRLEPVAAQATDLATKLRSIEPANASVAERLEHAAGAADHLRIATDLDAARKAFSGLGEAFLPLLSVDSRLTSGWKLIECPMVTDRFNKWVQQSADIENPFMGQAMLTCGNDADWKSLEPISPDVHDGDLVPVRDADGDIAYWTCAMHPSVHQSGPGQCPICGMTLLPVSREDAASGVLHVDEARRQRIGVRTALVEQRPMTVSIRAVGRTTYDESRVRDVTLKLDGWVEKLYVNETGQPIRKGQAMLALYSPELYAAQKEYLLAIRSQQAAQSTGAPGRADYLVSGARQRLRLWDLSDRQIDQIARTGEPLERMPILSPVSGFVVEKDIVEGASVRSGQRIFRVADLSTIWVEADVYEADLAQVHPGQQVRVSFPYVPGMEIQGRISYVYPWLDPSTRTGKIRVELPNPKLELKPEMYANVELESDRGSRVVVPDSAVIQTGPRQLVFIDLGDGRLEPRPVTLGARSDGWFEVLSGVKPGERVVTSANFLISSESRIRSAEQSWEGGDDATH